MTRRRKKTDGERITDLLASFRGFKPLSLSQLSARIDRAIRKSMAEAWEEGLSARDLRNWGDPEPENPYLKRRKKK